MPAIDLSTAIDAFKTVALASFNDALLRVQATTRPSNMTTDAQWAADKTKAKGEMASALDQLVHADTLISDANGRTGYSALAALMTTTKNTAETVYTHITNVSGLTSGTVSDQDARSRHIEALAAVLDGLARITPVALWQKVPETNAAK